MKKFMIEDLLHSYKRVEQAETLDQLLRRVWPTGYNYSYKLIQGTAVVTKVGSEIDSFLVKELHR